MENEWISVRPQNARGLNFLSSARWTCSFFWHTDCDMNAAKHERRQAISKREDMSRDDREGGEGGRCPLILWVVWPETLRHTKLCGDASKGTQSLERFI